MGKLAEIKTKETNANVDDFINSLPDEQKREDSRAILQLMKKATGEQPKMWGSSMIGFGNVRYKSPRSGREVDWFKIGFSPRKANFSLHLINIQHDGELLPALGKHKAGVGCIYFNKLADVDRSILEKLIITAVK